MAYNQPGNPFKKTKYISAAAGFDPSGVADELKNNPYAMMSKDYTRVKEGEFTRKATLEDQRNEYQRRIRVNQANRRAAKGADYEYINPHTGKVTKAKGKLSPRSNIGNFAPEGQTSSSKISADIPDINVGLSESKVDWQKVYEGRRQRAAETAKYGLTDSESERFTRKGKRLRNRMARKKKREARRRKRQIRRRNEGGFLSRLLGNNF